MDKVERQLDAARLALVALLAVITDDQLRSVNAALEAVGGLSETSHAALEELALGAVGDEHPPERDVLRRRARHPSRRLAGLASNRESFGECAGFDPGAAVDADRD